jgi:glycosyltransferase involved in cell wall biosynthesis
MAELLGVRIRIGGLWHAGSYDPQDFLGRLIGKAKWVRHAEKSMFHVFDHNYFATDFHIRMFVDNLLEDGFKSENPWYEEDFADYQTSSKIIRVGWPMEYLEHSLDSYKGMEKENLIVFPHRIAPEKQVEIFRDLKEQLPQYEFVVCQDQQLTKNEYHNILGRAKLVFSANLQETLGISWYEGALVDVIPMVPDRLSYSEMALDKFKYPSVWTADFNNYKTRRVDVCNRIVDYMENYTKYLPALSKQTTLLKQQFFSGNALYGAING